MSSSTPHACGHSGPDRARMLYVLALGAFVAAVAFVVFGGYLPDLARFGMPTMQPCFVDARSISGASVSLAQGLDPLVQNPGDVMGRPMNYPRVWLLLAQAGVGPEHTRWLALGFVLLLGVGLLALAPLATTMARALLLAIGVFSPVVWLGIERANNDLVVFGLVGLGAWLVARRPAWASGCVLAAAVLKLFPVFALVGLGAGGDAPGGRRRLRFGLLAALAFVGYVVVVRADLPKIRAGTYHWNRLGYGIDQLATTLAKTGWSAPLLLGGAIGVLVATSLASGWWRTRARLGASASPHALAAFLAGAGVYVGSFCLGSSFDYRLMFLLLALPQMATWCAATRGVVRVASVAALATVVLLLWSMTWRLLLQRALGSEAPGLLLDEALSWLLAVELLAALVLCVPDAVLPARWRVRPFLDAEPAKAMPAIAPLAAIVPAAVAAAAAPRDRGVGTGA